MAIYQIKSGGRTMWSCDAASADEALWMFNRACGGTVSGSETAEPMPIVHIVSGWGRPSDKTACGAARSGAASESIDPRMVTCPDCLKTIETADFD